MKQQAELFEQLGLPKQGLHLQAWMWEWHQKMNLYDLCEVQDRMKMVRVLLTIGREVEQSYAS